MLAAQAEGRLSNPTDAKLWMQRAATAPREADWSDLDPEGDSFDYSPQDWRRLVFSFGETGELIHPRFDAREPLRLPGVPDRIEEVDVSKAESVSSESEKLPDADVEVAVENPDTDTRTEAPTKGLAERLDSLLDKPKA